MGGLFNYNPIKNEAIPKNRSGPDDTFIGIPVENIVNDIDQKDGFSLEEEGETLLASKIPEAKALKPEIPEKELIITETDFDYELTDDTLAETAIPMGTAYTGPEVPLEEIEEELNLDSLDNSSGLVDLSKQAADTSLTLLSENNADDKRESHPETKTEESKNSNAKQTIAVKVIRNMKSRLMFQLLNRCKPTAKAEKWLLGLSFWIPRKFREYITGDILEDCNELRQLDYGEWRVRVHVLWHFTMAVIKLWPETIGSAIGTIVKRVLNTKN